MAYALGVVAAVVALLALFVVIAWLVAAADDVLGGATWACALFHGWSHVRRDHRAVCLKCGGWWMIYHEPWG